MPGWRSYRNLALLGEASLHDMTELAERAKDSFVGRCLRRFVAMAGLDRCIVLSSQAFTALIPLLILVSSLGPVGQSDAAATAVIRKFDLTGDSAAAAEKIFATPAGATGALSLSSALLLFLSGVSFTRRMQTMYRSAFDQEKAGIRGGLSAALGLSALLLEILVLYGLHGLVRGLALSGLWMLPVSIVTGLVLWTSIPYLLLNREVHWRRLLAMGGITAVGTGIAGVATGFYMAPLVTRYIQQFGLFGISVAFIGWLLTTSVILVASAAIGAEFDASHAAWARRLKTRYRLYDPQTGLPPVDTRTEHGGLEAGDVLLLLRVLGNWALLAPAVWAATAVVPGVQVVGGAVSYLALALFFGLVNAVLGPLLDLAALPLSLLTVGGAALVVNSILLAVTSLLSSRLDIDGLDSAVLGALVISLVTSSLELVRPRPARRRTTGDRVSG